MGNLLNKQKFTIKNKTEFEIHFYLSEHKLDLDITDIQPGPMVTTLAFALLCCFGS